jgi:hypothetical protein
MSSKALSILGGLAFQDTDLTLFLLQTLDTMKFEKEIQDKRYKMTITEEIVHRTKYPFVSILAHLSLVLGLSFRPR